MAIYHFSAKVISRARGSSAVAAAAYRSASRLEDERLGRAHDFTNKAGVIHSEVMAPEGAPERWQDRATLWNEVEAIEARRDAQLAREIEFSIPREMERADGVALARDFVKREFVDRGMVADLNVHWDHAEDGSPKPHAHVMLSMREVRPEGAGFGKKVREWNATSELEGWRERWSEHVNTRLAELGIEARIDHRSLKDQGIELEPQHKIGPAGMRREERGEDAERAVEHREIARRNGERIIAEPTVALDAITRQQSTFTQRDLQAFVFRHTDDKDQFDRAVSAVRASPEVVALGRDGRGRERFTTREMLGVEARLERSAETMAERSGHGVSAATRASSIAAAERRGLSLGGEQRDAFSHVVGGGDLSMTIGYAGTGKSAMLGVAREAWEASGWQVRGAALSGIAAENLEGGSGIQSRTIASLEHAWGQGREALTSRDVLVIDEAGMIGSRQMDRVLGAADKAGAKVVMIGDPEQLQAIEAGAAFRALSERHGAAEITQVRRQREDWQRDATRQLATGRTEAALEAYEGAGMVVGHATHQEARTALVEGWDAQRRAAPEESRVILAHTRADVAELNQLARGRMREAGELGEDQAISTERGRREFASGDRVMFLRNERSMGVKNGTLGTIEEIEGGRLQVRLDGPERRQVAFDVKDYADLDHGYASTIHKAQGVTVDRAHVLATPGLDRHAAYVALTRHRDGVELHYGGDHFADRVALAKTLGRERAKDTTLDYPKTFAERRGFEVPAEVQRPRERASSMFDGLKLGRGRSAEVAAEPPAATPKRSAFDGLKLNSGPTSPARSAAEKERETVGPLDRAVERYGRAYADAARMQPEGFEVLAHQKVALHNAGKALDEVRPDGASDLFEAIRRDPSLIAAAREGRTGPLKGALEQEAKVRASPELRAERFVQDWTQLKAEHARLGRGWEAIKPRQALEAKLGALAGGLQRDPQMAESLKRRSQELGLGARPQQELQQSLIRSLSLGRTLGMGR